MFNKLKNLFKSEPKPNWFDGKNGNGYQPLPQPKETPPMPKVKPPKKVLSEKERATAAGEPYVSIVKINIDPNNINDGAFELDFNDKFILNLIKSGYKIKADDTDAEMVDRWFTEVCRGVVMEMYEQQRADPDKRDLQPLTKVDERVVNRKDLGDGRSEIS